jgi:hypothetical protein
VSSMTKFDKQSRFEFWLTDPGGIINFFVEYCIKMRQAFLPDLIFRV